MFKRSTRPPLVSAWIEIRPNGQRVQHIHINLQGKASTTKPRRLRVADDGATCRSAEAVSRAV